MGSGELAEPARHVRSHLRPCRPSRCSSCVVSGINALPASASARSMTSREFSISLRAPLVTRGSRSRPARMVSWNCCDVTPSRCSASLSSVPTSLGKWSRICGTRSEIGRKVVGRRLAARLRLRQLPDHLGRIFAPAAYQREAFPGFVVTAARSTRLRPLAGEIAACTASRNQGLEASRFQTSRDSCRSASWAEACRQPWRPRRARRNQPPLLSPGAEIQLAAPLSPMRQRAAGLRAACRPRRSSPALICPACRSNLVEAR